MPENSAGIEEEEVQSIVKTMDEFNKSSQRTRKEIERLPIHFRDAVTRATIEPFLKEGKGITPRRVVERREEVLRRLVKEHFRRQGYECYTDDDGMWTRARSRYGGYGKEDYPMPDVFAKKPTRIVVAEVKASASEKNIRDCIHKLTECSKFANSVYAAFPTPCGSKRKAALFARKMKRLEDSIRNAGVLLVDERDETVQELRGARDHRPTDQKKWNDYYQYQFDRARARSAGRRSFISLRLTKREKEEIEESVD